MWKKVRKRVINSSFKGGVGIMDRNRNYKAEDLPLEIKPEVREKCNN